MTDKLMVGEIQLCYFTFCEATRNQNWKKVRDSLIKEFKGFFGASKRKRDWWNVVTIDNDFDATLLCRNTVTQVEALAQRWIIRTYYPMNQMYDIIFMVPFIKHYCNPHGVYILEKVALETMI